MKLHQKHIIPGFSYYFVDDPNNLRIITELLENTDYCRIFEQKTGEYYKAVRERIVQCFREGKIVLVNSKKYTK